MVIDIIKNKLSRAVLFVLFFFKASSLYSQDCKVYVKVFEIVSKDFPAFENDLNSFYSSINEYDFISLKLKGGSSARSKLTRMYFKGRWMRYVNLGGKDGDVKFVKIDSTAIDSLLKNFADGSFMQVCPYYNSANDTYVIMLKRNEKIFFRFTGENDDYSGLNNLSELVKVIESN